MGQNLRTTNELGNDLAELVMTSRTSISERAAGPLSAPELRLRQGTKGHFPERNSLLRELLVCGSRCLLPGEK
jgi:hypothetical protein